MELISYDVMLPRPGDSLLFSISLEEKRLGVSGESRLLNSEVGVQSVKSKNMRGNTIKLIVEIVVKWW